MTTMKHWILHWLILSRIMSCTPSFRLPMSLVSGIKFAIMRDADTQKTFEEGQMSTAHSVSAHGAQAAPPLIRWGESLQKGIFCTVLVHFVSFI